MGERRNELLVRMAGAIVKGRRVECFQCGACLNAGARFCAQCGVAVLNDGKPQPSTAARAGLTRRMMAEVIDRLIPLPFVSFFFPMWTLVVVAYHLVCDGTPSGRSLGKWVCRLRVISTGTGAPCGIARSAMRRLPTAITQAAYCAWMMIPFVVAFELFLLAMVWLNPTGRRLEDYIAGTQVITESEYRKLNPDCEGCGHSRPSNATYCPNCGKRMEEDYV